MTLGSDHLLKVFDGLWRWWHFGSVISTYLVWFRSTLHLFLIITPHLGFFHTYILFWAHPSHVHDIWPYPALLIKGEYRPVPSFWVGLSCAFWTLVSTFPIIVGLVRLLMGLWWCFHFGSWHVMTWCTFRLRVLVSFIFIHPLVCFDSLVLGRIVL